ncbi:right-handed parallel beta-helix repeat-containing protein [Tamlana fucoidanivorans]|uniref:Glycoside hydrolase family 28 protein n=1 Tax=Allotamlana fucoidanivorans TaxID=2583814 RepID=A0A5C4SR73_9FLAO|nr:glycosyl hydrolase family 28 protein [Tamlana fucoidanivorans]TNJ46577.1 glycoside hydrolase family 28 protein [Tamlana fucoidanivorans]
MKNLIIFFVILCHATIHADTYNILDYGAKADGKTLDTKSVQNAIDACTQNGGGTVIIPSGKTVLIGTIYLKDFVTLYLENGSVLLGSPNISDYATDTYKNMYKNEPHMDRCLIFAKNAKSFTIKGEGTIDGNGYTKNFTREKGGRPMMIRFLHCNDIKIKNVSLINPAAWTSAWLYCNEIVVEGIKIVSRVNNNGDGLDFDGCTNVRVSNSSFDTSDDSICLQTSHPDFPCKDIVVTNCVFTSKWAGMRIGLSSRGDFESVTVSNCTFHDIQDSGLKIQMNEGGEMKNMAFSNLVMRNVPRPIFMTFCQQRAGVESPMEMFPMKAMHGFLFSNFIVDNRELDKNSAIFITGMPNHYITDIQLNNVLFTVSGKGSKVDASKSDFNEYTLDVLNGWWPEFRLVGTLPAYGIFARHVDRISINNVQIKTIDLDERPPIVFDDVPEFSLNQIFANQIPVKVPKILNK